jgi:hypothetical protein
MANLQNHSSVLPDALFALVSDSIKVPALRVPHLEGMLMGMRILDAQYTLNEKVDVKNEFEKIVKFFEQLNENYVIGWAKEQIIDNKNNVGIFKMTVVTEPKSGLTQMSDFIALICIYYSNKPVLKLTIMDDARGNKIKESLFDTVIKDIVYKPPLSITRVTISDNCEINAHSSTIDVGRTKVYPEFYPYMDTTPEELITGFYKSRCRLMIFTGIWGSGKSSLLRATVNYNTGPFILVDSSSIYQEQSKFDALISHVTWLTENLKPGEYVTLMLEEADRLIAPKTDNFNSALPQLLSFTEGVLDIKVKVIVVTNLTSVSKFDGGLTRGGRLYETITFKELTPDQANAARSVIGLDPLNFKEKIALGSALFSTKEKIKLTTENRGIGFEA